MTVADFLDRYESILKEFKKIVIIQDGDFDMWQKSYFTFKYIKEKYGDFEIRYNIYQTDVAFIALENTNKQRGGITVKAYLYKIKNILPLMSGVVFWHKTFKNKKFECSIDNLNLIEAKGLSDMIIDTVKISRDLFVLIQLKDIWRNGVKIDWITVKAIGNRRIRRIVKQQCF